VLPIFLAFFLLLILWPICLYNAGEKEYAKFVLNIVGGIGVFLAVLMAVYGDRIRRWVNLIRLKIEEPKQSDNFPNEVDAPGGGKTRVFCHHLRVKNRMPTEPVRNCRVWLVKILDENGRGGFEEKFKFAVPRLMDWAPREYSPHARDFSEDDVFDFGTSFVEQGGRFEVGFYKSQGGMFKGGCLAGQKRQYVFKITADNYIKARPITVEVDVRRCEPTQDWQYGTRTLITVKG
jgi:hypothetical protein